MTQGEPASPGEYWEVRFQGFSTPVPPLRLRARLDTDTEEEFRALVADHARRHLRGLGEVPVNAHGHLVRRHGSITTARPGELAGTYLGGFTVHPSRPPLSVALRPSPWLPLLGGGIMLMIFIGAPFEPSLDPEVDLAYIGRALLFTAGTAAFFAALSMVLSYQNWRDWEEPPT